MPGLSTGAKAGIGIGCAMAALVLLAVLLLWRRLRKSPTDQGSKASHGEIRVSRGGSMVKTGFAVSSNSIAELAAPVYAQTGGLAGGAELHGESTSRPMSELDGRSLPAYRGQG